MQIVTAQSILRVKIPLASAIACCYPELREFRKLPLNNISPGSLVTYFDQQHQRFIYNLVTKRQFFSQTYLQNT